jgi:3D (Asp-Asp-Asp) domain-containing protein
MGVNRTPRRNWRETSTIRRSDRMSFTQTVVRSALVLGQAHTPRRRFLPFAAIALLMLAAPAVGGADPSRTATLHTRDALLAAKSRTAVLGLYSLDQQLGATQARLGTLQEQAVRLKAEQASLAHRLSIARLGAVRAQSRLGARLRLLYEEGSVEPLEIVLGAKNLDDALTSLDNLSRISGQGEDVLRELKAARLHILAAQRSLAGRRAALAQATAQARETASSLTRTRSARTAYIGSLASQRRLTQRQIDTLVAQAQAAHLRSQKLARSTTVVVLAADTSPPANPTVQSNPVTRDFTGGGRTITVTATGYALGGRTATGLHAGWGVAAVDPAVIPLGSHMTVPGYGEAVAADIGGSVVGATIDLWFPTVAQANAWGRRIVTIVVH